MTLKNDSDDDEMDKSVDDVSKDGSGEKEDRYKGAL